MQRFFPTALFFILVFVYFNPVVSIKCYVCRSENDDGCTGEMNSSLVQECDKKPGTIYQYCRKISQQLYFLDEKEVTIIRECAYEKNVRQCYKLKWLHAAYQEVCECDDDLCNRSSKGFHSGLAMLTPLFLLYLLIR